MTKQSEKKERTVVVGPNFLAHWYIYDFEYCADRKEMERVMQMINHRGYDLVSVTQDAAGVYTIFFRRRACG